MKPENLRKAAQNHPPAAITMRGICVRWRKQAGFVTYGDGRLPGLRRAGIRRCQNLPALHNFRTFQAQPTRPLGVTTMRSHSLRFPGIR